MRPGIRPRSGGMAGIGRDDAYRHVRLSGRFLNDRETLIQAVTDYGAALLGGHAPAPERRHCRSHHPGLRAGGPEGTRPRGRPDRSPAPWR